MTPREWDAATYDRVSGIQLAWGLEVLARLELRGDETVLDAGCGTGRVTLALLERLPRGRVVAVDGSEAMVSRARETLPPEVDVLCQDLVELRLEEPVDVVFSNAVFHWIHDHRRLFVRLHAALRPGGRLHAQCGGEGNLARFLHAAAAVIDGDPFEPYLRGVTDAWNFSSPQAAERALGAAGFDRLRGGLEPKDVVPEDAHAFLSTVVLGPHLDRLPEELRAPFVEATVERAGEPVELDYVRLNLSAHRP